MTKSGGAQSPYMQCATRFRRAQRNRSIRVSDA